MNGLISSGRVAGALIDSGDYDEVDEFSFAEAMEYPAIINRATLGVDAIAHSSGILPLEGTSPSEIIAFGSPLPTEVHCLLGRTVRLIVGLHLPGAGLKTPGDVWAVASCDFDIIKEFGEHLLPNVRHLGEVATFNSIHLARDAVASGIPTSLVYTPGDEYFVPSGVQIAEAAASGVNLMTLPSGVHAELVLRPAETLAAYQLMAA